MPELKTFRGPTITDAIAQVKKDLGADAVIVKTRSYRAGTLLGMGGKPIVEIIASAPSSNQNSTKGRLKAALANVYEDVPQRRRPLAIPAQPSTPAEQTERAANPVPPASPSLKSRLRAIPVDPAPIDLAAAESLRDELGSIKRMVSQLLRCSAQGALPREDRHANAAILDAGGMPEPLFAQYTRLLDGGVEKGLAETLIATVRQELTSDQLGNAKAVRSAILQQLAGLIPCEPLAEKPAAHKPHVLALIGPTGVGKTTTIAKLAAEHALRRNRKVALITSDTYRIGAVDQLREYAQIIGVPLHIAATPNEMTRAIGRCQGCDLVLIDTAGRSPQDNQRIEDLRAIVDAASADARLLVLSAAASEAAMRRVAGRFAALRPAGLILTKLDEAGSLGSIVNLPRAISLPLSHITTGQDVPDFIEPARPDRLAAIVLDGEVSQETAS